MVFKTFNAGDVLTAADVNGYLMQQSVIVCTSGTRPGSPVTGMTILETDTGRYMLWDGSSWVPTASIGVVKPSDESVTSNISQQDDNHLTLPVAANTNYWVDAYVIYDALAAADIALGWTGPAGATMNWIADGYGGGTALTGDSATPDGVKRSNFTISQTPSMGGGGSGVNFVVAPRGVLQVAGTAGALTLRWTQGSSSATATRVRAGSALKLTRLS
ncbi:hypothetical protein [Spongiactinospora sp. TRM90649]|uniref:hypothetical protein n=1 Tax=Spongiactinospora sp. TRM90649 TaxID=3031114 RepID=UPI0023F73622|nr:hypothetical protein [Spongiactinospora sp. TRM90649]MDF5755828.1 hypothetical protein [Spongiactinospora sp. TRM90649]